MTINLLPSITTITPGGWCKKVKEIDRLKLRTVALFPTCLDKKTRRRLYAALEKTKLKIIPFVHLRAGDMGVDEIAYLIRRWGTKAFNVHSPRQYAVGEAVEKKYHGKIFLENTDYFWDENEIRRFAGLCLDFAHLESDRLSGNLKYWRLGLRLINKYPVGCGHISAVRAYTHYDRDRREQRHDFHAFEKLSDFDYLRRFPVRAFPHYAALELENPLAEQLQAKQQVALLLADKGLRVV